jgi:hypothetical protein
LPGLFGAINHGDMHKIRSKRPYKIIANAEEEEKEEE